MGSSWTSSFCETCKCKAHGAGYCKATHFCIEERISPKAAFGNQVVVFTPTNVAFDHHSTMLRDEVAIEEFKEMANEFDSGRCYNRERMVEEIQALQLTRPGMEGRRRRISRH